MVFNLLNWFTDTRPTYPPIWIYLPDDIVCAILTRLYLVDPVKTLYVIYRAEYLWPTFVMLLRRMNPQPWHWQEILTMYIRNDKVTARFGKLVVMLGDDQLCLVHSKIINDVVCAAIHRNHLLMLNTVIDWAGWSIYSMDGTELFQIAAVNAGVPLVKYLLRKIFLSLVDFDVVLTRACYYGNAYLAEIAFLEHARFAYDAFCHILCNQDTQLLMLATIYAPARVNVYISRLLSQRESPYEWLVFLLTNMIYPSYVAIDKTVMSLLYKNKLSVRYPHGLCLGESKPHISLYEAFFRQHGNMRSLDRWTQEFVTTTEFFYSHYLKTTLTEDSSLLSRDSQIIKTYDFFYPVRHKHNVHFDIYYIWLSYIFFHTITDPDNRWSSMYVREPNVYKIFRCFRHEDENKEICLTDDDLDFLQKYATSRQQSDFI